MTVSAAAIVQIGAIPLGQGETVVTSGNLYSGALLVFTNLGKIYSVELYVRPTEKVAT